MSFSTAKPSHVYIGREKCGCCTLLTNEEYTKDMTETYANLLRSGRKIERITWDYYINVVRHELGFMNCVHN